MNCRHSYGKLKQAGRYVCKVCREDLGPIYDAEAAINSIRKEIKSLASDVKEVLSEMEETKALVEKLMKQNEAHTKIVNEQNEILNEAEQWLKKVAIRQDNLNSRLKKIEKHM